MRESLHQYLFRALILNWVDYEGENKSFSKISSILFFASEKKKDFEGDRTLFKKILLNFLLFFLYFTDLKVYKTLKKKLFFFEWLARNSLINFFEFIIQKLESASFTTSSGSLKLKNHFPRRYRNLKVFHFLIVFQR